MKYFCGTFIVGSAMVLLAAALPVRSYNSSPFGDDSRKRANPPARQPDTTQPALWKLVWSDEFDHDGLPDPNKWAYERGFVRNHEAQCYMRERTENARVEKGHLVIEARKEHLPNPNYDPRHAGDGRNENRTREFIEYTSASLTTQDKFAWCYGRFEIRVKVGMTPGMWPAFWTLGENISKVSWPRCGEIDIMELFSARPREVTSTVHWSRGGKHSSAGGKIPSETSLDEFHVYALEWYPDRLDFFFDGKKYHTEEVAKFDDGGDNAFHKPHFLILNLALGGTAGGKIDDGKLPQQMVVDYVRVYQLKEALPGQVMETKAPAATKK